jgi:hypothetical protein
MTEENPNYVRIDPNGPLPIAFERSKTLAEREPNQTALKRPLNPGRHKVPSSPDAAFVEIDAAD